MSTKITKWTREKKSDKKTDFRDKTRQSHADLPFGISSEENWRIHTLASKLEKLPNEPQKESSLAASVAVGSSQNANDAAIQKRIHKLRQEKDAYKSQPSSTDQVRWQPIDFASGASRLCVQVSDSQSTR